MGMGMRMAKAMVIAMVMAMAVVMEMEAGIMEMDKRPEMYVAYVQSFLAQMFTGGNNDRSKREHHQYVPTIG